MKIPSFNSVPSSSGFHGPLARGASEASDSAAGEPSHIGKRLRAWGTKMEKRLSNALASPNLTDQQRAKLELLNRKFHMKLERLIDTYLRRGGSEKNVQGEIDSFEKSLDGALWSGTTAPTDPSNGLDTLA